MSKQFSTLNQLSVDLGADPRTVALELNNAGIEPDGELTSVKGKRVMPIYDREKIRKALAKSLRESAEKFARES
jgi:hypothetical protein